MCASRPVSGVALTYSALFDTETPMQVITFLTADGIVQLPGHGRRRSSQARWCLSSKMGLHAAGLSEASAASSS